MMQPRDPKHKAGLSKHARELLRQSHIEDLKYDAARAVLRRLEALDAARDADRDWNAPLN